MSTGAKDCSIWENCEVALSSTYSNASVIDTVLKLVVITVSATEMGTPASASPSTTAS